MDKCPYCGADTRPGDNFCLNCGNRLLPATPSSTPPQQALPVQGDATLAAPDDWGAALSSGGTAPASGSGWVDDGAQTIASSSAEQALYRSDSAPTAQATIDRVEQPARFILRSENGEVLQEYPLDKLEVVIGRAPSSDILLSKDKLTSRKHATVYYENGTYFLRDERSANGTFVNGQQIEENIPRVLQDGDHVGIGEHELIFRSYESAAVDLENHPTVVVPFDEGAEKTFRTQQDEGATLATGDDFSTHSMDEVEEKAAAPVPPTPIPSATPKQEPTPLANGFAAANISAPSVPGVPSFPNIPSTPVPTPGAPVNMDVPSTPPVVSPPSAEVSSVPAQESAPPPPTPRRNSDTDTNVTFNRLSSLPLPTLPDLTSLIAALSSLDGQVNALQEQFNTTQDAMRNHETEIGQTSNQLRAGIRQVSDRMDKTIADVARSREALAWADLLQLMDDVMNNPRDIEYVTKLARKARELNKVFQIHQNVLNAMAECNSLLRGMIGDEK